MKILITGSIGVGKSTFLDALPKNTSLIKIPEVARRVLYEAPDLRLNPYFQRVLLLEQYYVEKEAEKMGKDFIICDRGYVDVMAYAKYFNVEVDESIIRSFTPYDMIFYCHPEGTPLAPEKIPGVTPNPEEKILVDQSIASTLQEMNIPWCTLKGPTEQRLETFYSVFPELDEGRVIREGRISKER